MADKLRQFERMKGVTFRHRNVFFYRMDNVGSGPIINFRGKWKPIIRTLRKFHKWDFTEEQQELLDKALKEYQNKKRKGLIQ